ncbi:MAG: helix-turn-helix domain-containing protein [Sphingomonadaceae bacterium]
MSGSIGQAGGEPSPKDAATAEAMEVIGRLGPIADRLATRGAVAQYEADLNNPALTRMGSSLAGTTGPLPRYLPVRDLVHISFNLHLLAVDDTIPRRQARSISLPTDDHLTHTVPYAPNLRVMLELLVRYGNVMLPWFRRRIEVKLDELQFIYAPVTSLGRIESLSTEVSLATIHRIIEMFIGPEVSAARVHFALRPVSDLTILNERFSCPVTVGCGETHITVPLTLCNKPSSHHDPVLWRERLARCEADISLLEQLPLVSRVRERVREQLEIGRVTKAGETANALGKSERSLVRGLTAARTTHHRIVDEERRLRASTLLKDFKLPLAEVADQLGFPDQSSFGRKCIAWFGESPARWRVALAGGLIQRPQKLA